MADVSRPYDLICDAVLRSRAQHSSPGVATEIVRSLDAGGWTFVHRSKLREHVSYGTEPVAPPAVDGEVTS